MNTRADFIVIGAGIAGLSAAAEIAANADIVVLEKEDQPGYHATGRSAAYFAPAYGNDTVRGISAACELFFRAPPQGFTDAPLLRPREAIFIGREDQQAAIAGLQSEVSHLIPLNAADVGRRVPILDQGYVVTGLLDPAGGDLDVDALMQGYTRLLKRRGGRVDTAIDVKQITYNHGLWTLETSQGNYSAPTIINAAGAWADPVAAMAGLSSIGIEPKRRTAVLIDAPSEYDITDWPLTLDVDEAFYFKPDAGQLLISPADETPSPPCDAQAEDLDVAIAIDRFSTATGIEVRRVNHRWAGLRSFAPDKTFVVGMDPRHPGFFWLAGQGGYGVQSAPALANLTHHLLTGAVLSGEYASLSRFIDAVNPQRLIQN
jgi:D-arginine dehydrogenase